MHDDGHDQESELQLIVLLDELEEAVDLDATDDSDERELDEETVDLDATDDSDERELDEEAVDLDATEESDEHELDESESQHWLQSACTQPQLAFATFTPPVMRNLFE